MTRLFGGLSITLLLIASCVCVGQEKVESGSSSQRDTKPSNCEYNVSILTGAHRVAGDDGLVIIIARLGSGETKRELIQRRLHNARTFLVVFGNRSPKTIVTAEGDRVDGYGRVELYAGGKLFDALVVGRNADLPIGGCSFDGDDPCTYEREKQLYPCLDRRRNGKRLQ